MFRSRHASAIRSAADLPGVPAIWYLMHPAPAAAFRRRSAETRILHQRRAFRVAKRPEPAIRTRKGVRSAVFPRIHRTDPYDEGSLPTSFDCFG